MAKRITYGDLTQLLESEGFVRAVIPGSHIVFAHKQANTSLFLPIHKSGMPAAPRHIAMVRGTLIDFGVMSEPDFDRWAADPKHFQAA